MHVIQTAADGLTRASAAMFQLHLPPALTSKLSRWLGRSVRFPIAKSSAAKLMLKGGPSWVVMTRTLAASGWICSFQLH